MLLCSFISNEMKGGICQIYTAGPFNTKSYFKRHKAEMGFSFPACQSPGIHSTGRCPTRPKETVGEHCAGQLANATILCTTVTFLAFGSFFFFFVHFWDIVNVLYCFLQKRKKIIGNWIQMWHFLGLFPHCSYRCFYCLPWGCLVYTFPWVAW